MLLCFFILSACTSVEFIDVGEAPVSNIKPDKHTVIIETSTLFAGLSDEELLPLCSSMPEQAYSQFAAKVL
jgi:hypothetical protein